jgi:hypothetical protein
LFDHIVELHLHTWFIKASQWISEFIQSQSPIKSVTLFEYGLNVQLESRSMTSS